MAPCPKRTRFLAAATLACLAAFARPATASDDARPFAPTDPSPSLALQLHLMDGAGGDAPSPRPKTVLGLPRNVGPIDRALRLAAAAALVGVGSYRLANDSPHPGLSWAMIGVAAIPGTTGAVGYCSLYPLLGIDYTF